ncbi:hypothetical protein NL676_026010 [Syzygium grande]|nr:hypothetical protein NL676_026010 [Syzygium grande]
MSPTSAMLTLPLHSHQARRSHPRNPDHGAPGHNNVFMGFVSGKLGVSGRSKAEAAVESAQGFGSASPASRSSVAAARFQEALELSCWSS